MPDPVSALDAGRAFVLRRAMRIPEARAIFIDPRRRIPVAALGALAFAFASALGAPLLSLWLGAAILGVPHVVSGIRHVALRGRVHRLTLVCAGLGAAVGVLQIAGAGQWTFQAFALLFAASAAGEVLAAGASGAPLPRTASLLLLVIAGGAAGVAFPGAFLLWMTHLHAIGSLAWFAARARRRGIVLWPLLLGVSLIVAGAAIGLLDPLFATTLIAPRSAIASIITEATGAALPGLSVALFRRALFLYAFGQSLHFAVWLRLVPEVDRAAPVPQTYRRALVLLAADLRRARTPMLVACALAVPFILVGGGPARESYFAVTYFHFGLEAAALVRLLARGTIPTPSVVDPRHLQHEFA